VLVVSGFSTISQANITDIRQFANVPNQLGVTVVNNSANILNKGSLVIRDTASTSTPYLLPVTTSTTLRDNKVVGIAEARITSAGGTGRIITAGLTPVTCDMSVALGDFLVQSTTAGQATQYVAPSPLTVGVFSPFGVVVAANTGVNTNCLALVNFSTFQTIRPTFATGSYTGNGAATQAVTGLGFQPSTIQIYNRLNASLNLYIWWKSSADGTKSKTERVAGADTYLDDMIISLDSDGFTVGDGTGSGLAVTNQLNNNTVVYTNIAFG
jgi:hypothetical protein